MTTFALANYPIKFHGYKVRETNFCLQFEDATTRLRIDKDRQSLPKLGTGERYIPVSELGTDFRLIGVNCPMSIVEDLQLNLIAAYGIYYRLYGKSYKERTGRSFCEFLYATKQKLDALLEQIKRMDE